MDQYGLIGKKLTHSFSPEIHKLLGSYPYDLIELEPEAVEGFLKKGNYTGLNVTIPYKKVALAACDELSALAAEIGSVNTVVRRPDGSLYGDNTDAFGFTYMVEHAGISVKNKKCLVIGNGGSSAMVQVVLRKMGASEVVVISHKDNRPENLAPHYRTTKVIVNTTPVGMYPNCDESPLTLLPFSTLEGVVDLIYNPYRTQLIQEAIDRKICCTSGLPMLVAQAVRAYEIFFDKKAEEGTIERVLETVTNRTLNLLLIGMPGSGKSTVGRILAEKIDRELIDTDRLIEEKTGQKIPDIFASKGEEAFRRLETDVLADMTKLSGKVISTGGGVVTVPMNLRLLRRNSRVIFINRPLDELATDGRPLSQSGNLKLMLRKRLPLYRQCADLEIPFLSSEQVASRIFEYYHLEPKTSEQKKILILNGPNLNMLGIREPTIYGEKNYTELVLFCQSAARQLDLTVDVFQSNHEGVLVDQIQKAYGEYDGIVLNPAAYTHTSVALLDALKAVGIPTVEVHLSDVSKREDFRQISYVRLAALKTITGKGFEGYREALEFLKDYLA